MVGDTPIQVSDDARPGWSRLVLTGRITVACAGEFHKTALALIARPNNVTVCCAGTEFLDASAIQILLCLGRELVGRGNRCDFVGVTAALGADFRVAGVGNG